MYLIEYIYVCHVNIKRYKLYDGKLPRLCYSSFFYFCIY